MLVCEIGCKITNFFPNTATLPPVKQSKCGFYVESYLNGATEQAFGARIRIAFAIVGAIRSTVAGVVTR